MRKIATMLLSTALIIGLAGCGVNNGSTTVATSEDTVKTPNAESEISIDEPYGSTADTAEEFEYDEPEIEADALWDNTQETSEEASNTSLFTQPIPGSSEMYSESDIDNYLANAKVNYQDYFSTSETGRTHFDMDGFMEACGYENIGGFDAPNYYKMAAWWIERNGVKICYFLVDNGMFLIYASSGNESAIASDILRDSIGEDDIITDCSFYVERMAICNGNSIEELKGNVAVAYYLSRNDVDLAKMPLSHKYLINVPENFIPLDKDLTYFYDQAATNGNEEIATSYHVYE